MFDNLDMFYRHQRELDEAEGRRPHCCICGEPIWQDRALRLEDGLMCDSCIEEHQEWIDEY